MSATRDLTALPHFDATTPPGEIYRIGRELAGGRITMACSFSMEDIVLIELLHSHLNDFTVFAIDTGRLNEETCQVAEQVSQRFGVQIDWFLPDNHAVEELASSKGLFSFRDSLENRRECCRIRKLEPLQRAIKGASAWITGMRREQSMTRSAQQPLEIDHVNGGLLKINPLTYWTERQVRDYAGKQHLPVNALYQQGYTSIGCAPCTRATRDGEHARAGRWWWECDEHRECGLHRR